MALETRRARIGAGLSLRAVAAAARIDHARVWRFERGQFGELTTRDVAALGAVVGLDVRLRAYPAGDPIRDAGQQRLLNRVREQLHASLRWMTEVPLPIDGDLRAWDAVIAGSGWRIAVEAETALEDLQALERRLALKQRDGGERHLLLVVADTRRNRAALEAGPAAFNGFARNPRATLRAIRTGADPGCSAIVVL